jgi:hypothetical protein
VLDDRADREQRGRHDEQRHQRQPHALNEDLGLCATPWQP